MIRNFCPLCGHPIPHQYCHALPSPKESKSEATGVYQQEDLDAANKRADELHARLNIVGSTEKVQPTPRTDALMRDPMTELEDVVVLARQLERELVKALDDYAWWRHRAEIWREKASAVLDEWKAAQSATLPIETTLYPEPPPHVQNKDDFYTGCTAYKAALKAALASTTKREGEGAQENDSAEHLPYGGWHD